MSIAYPSHPWFELAEPPPAPSGLLASPPQRADRSGAPATRRRPRPAAPRDTVERGDRALEQLKTLLSSETTSSTLAGTIDVGELTFRVCYGCDWSSRAYRGRKRRSLRSLAALPGVSASTGKLWRSLVAYGFALAIPGFRDFRKVGVGHLGVLSGLPFAVQCSLLEVAERRGWSRRKLQSEAKALLHTPGATPGADTPRPEGEG